MIAFSMLGDIDACHGFDFQFDAASQVIQSTGIPVGRCIDHHEPIPSALGGVFWRGLGPDVDVHGGVICDGLLFEKGAKFCPVVLGPKDVV